MRITLDNVKLAFKAWGVGLLSAGIVFLPLSLILRESDAATLLTVSPMWFLNITLTVATFGPIVSAPLFLIALVFSVIFERLPARYPKMISALAVILTVLIVAAATAHARDNPWAVSRSFLEKISHFTLSWETWLTFALPVGVGSYFYCSRLRKRATPPCN